MVPFIMEWTNLAESSKEGYVWLKDCFADAAADDDDDEYFIYLTQLHRVYVYPPHGRSHNRL
jgi:hypothetical protein